MRIATAAVGAFLGWAFQGVGPSRDARWALVRTEPTIVDLVGDRDVKASTDVRHIAIGAPGPVSQRVSCINDAIAMYASTVPCGHFQKHLIDEPMRESDPFEARP